MKYTYFLLFTICILCSACEKDYSVQYRIQNNAGKLIEVSGEININGQETIPLTAIDSLNSITIAVVSGTGETTSDYLANIDQLISDGIINLSIQNIDGAPFNRDPLDPNIWTTIEPIDDNDPGFILLQLNAADFL